MRVLVTADIHLGYSKSKTGAINFLKQLSSIKGYDVILIAGDLAENGVDSGTEIGENHRRAFELLKETGCPNIGFIAGSHDIWTTDDSPDSWQIFTNILYDLSKEYEITYLERENLVIGNVAFCGTMAHYDYSMADMNLIINGMVVTKKHYKKNTPPGESEPWWGDYGRLRWDFDDPQACSKILEMFDSRLSDAVEIADKVMVISHTVPILDINGHIFNTTKIKSRFRNAYSGTRELNKILLARNRDGKIKEVISGHTHYKSGPIKKDGIRYRNLGGDYGKPKYQIIEI